MNVKKPLFKLYARIWSWIYKLEKKIIILSLCLHFFSWGPFTILYLFFSVFAQIVFKRVSFHFEGPLQLSESVGVNSRHHFNFSLCDFCFLMPFDYTVFQYPPRAYTYIFFTKQLRLKLSFAMQYFLICIPHFSHLRIENEWRQTNLMKMKHEKLTVIGSLVSPISDSISRKKKCSDENVNRWVVFFLRLDDRKVSFKSNFTNSLFFSFNLERGIGWRLRRKINFDFYFSFNLYF